jgi:hypothetical protein
MLVYHRSDFFAGMTCLYQFFDIDTLCSRMDCLDFCRLASRDNRFAGEQKLFKPGFTPKRIRG